MADSKKRNEECGPFIACGAACVSFDHEEGQPTSIDYAIAALKRFFSKEHRAQRKKAASGKRASADKRVSTAQEL